MAKDKLPTPMLAAFLGHIKPPAGRVLPEWMDWTIAIIAFFLFHSILHKGGVLISIAVAFTVGYACRTIRLQQISRQSRAFQTQYERWSKTKRLVDLQSEFRIHLRVPRPVLAALEGAARTWHEVRETSRSLALSDSLFTVDLEKALDECMLAATAAASPVVLRDEQGGKDLRRMEEDTELMARVVTQINHQDLLMQGLAPNTDGTGTGSADSLRRRLDAARLEREAAEAELDELSIHPKS